MLKLRKGKIEKAAKTAAFVFDNHNGRKVYAVESEDGRPYQVICDWVKENGVATARCQTFVFEQKKRFNEKGNHRVDFNPNTVGYFVLGALKWAAREQGKTLALCNSYLDAVRLSSIGGEIIKIENLGGGEVWATIN